MTTAAPVNPISMDGPNSNKKPLGINIPRGYKNAFPRFSVGRAASRSRTVRMGVSAGATGAIGLVSAMGAYRNTPVPVPAAVFHVCTRIQSGPTARQ